MAKTNTDLELEMIQRLTELDTQAAELPDSGKLRIRLAECQSLVMDARVKRIKAETSS